MKYPTQDVTTNNELPHFKILSSLVGEVKRDIDALHDKLEHVLAEIEELKDTPVQYVGFADKKALEARIQQELNETITVMVSEAKKDLKRLETGTEHVLSIVDVGLPT